MVRQGLRTFLELNGEVLPPALDELPIEVVGEAADCEDAVALAACLQPDVILLDLVLPVMNGLQATPLIRKYSPCSRVILLTSPGDADKIIPAIHAGAQGYVPKNIPPAELIRSIRLALKGQLAPQFEAAQMFFSVSATGEVTLSNLPATKAADRITGKEREVLRLMARGLSDQQIAEQMAIDEETVQLIVSTILDSLDLDDRSQAATYARQNGLIEDQA